MMNRLKMACTPLGHYPYMTSVTFGSADVIAKIDKYYWCRGREDERPKVIPKKQKPLENEMMVDLDELEGVL